MRIFYKKSIIFKTAQKSKHEGVRYPCVQCEYTVAKLSSLQRHKQSYHEVMKSPCDQNELVECRVTSKKIKLTAENEKTEHDFVKCEPDPECDDYDNSIKEEVLEEDSLAGY